MKALLVLFSALKFGKVLTTGGTMLISVGAYAFMFGWWYAVGFVALLLVHELGHYIAARQRGLNVGAPTFIPFVGAWIELKEAPMDVETEAYVAVAGPFLGTLGALACYFLARSWDSTLLLALAYAGFFLNLFNLIPLSPLDGGRITAILSPRVWLLGVPMLVALFFYRPSPLLVILGIIAAPQVWKAIKFNPQAPENQRYYAAAASTRLEYAVLYLGLAAFLAIMGFEVHEQLEALHSGRL
ncbi:MAG: site-2 protease family protein [Alphaproteobacteria bacterium]|nr:site-2 protease family protein [Alphaproteobacteria bacterium]